MNAPSSALWLMRHELRLWWRGAPVGTVGAVLLGLGLLLWLGLHFAGYGMGLLLARVAPGGADSVPPGVARGAGMAATFWSVLMTLSALPSALAGLFRADADLWMASPVSARSVLLVRVARVAVTSGLPLFLFTIPLINGAAVVVGPAMLMAYVFIIGDVLTCAAVATVFAVGLARWLGIGRARAITTLVIVGISAGINIVGRRSAGTQAGIGGRIGIWLGHGVLGLPLPGLEMLGVGVLAVWLSVLVSARWLDASLLAEAEPSQATARKARIEFRSGMRALLRKEARLLRRVPNLVLQFVRLIPFLVVVGGTVSFRDVATAKTFGLAMTAASVVLAGAFLPLALAVDPARDLAAASPLRPALVIRAKWIAGLMPPLCGLALLAFVAPVAGADAALRAVPMALGGIAGEGLIARWIPASRTPGKASAGRAVAAQIGSLVNLFIWFKATQLILN